MQIQKIFCFSIFLFLMSCDTKHDLDHYYLSPVSVADFAEFVEATNYQTDAEAYGWSIVQEDIIHFKTVRGADWRKPDGVGESKADFPVTQVSHNDAIAYCKWSNTRLPTYEEYWKLVKNDKRSIAFNITEFFALKDVNLVGNVWEITYSDSPEQVRLAGGSIFCDVNSCNGVSPDRELFVDAITGNIHIGFAVLRKKE